MGRSGRNIDVSAGTGCIAGRLFEQADAWNSIQKLRRRGNPAMSLHLGKKFVIFCEPSWAFGGDLAWVLLVTELLILRPLVDRVAGA